MEEKILYNATACFLAKDGKILLGVKQQKIGKGCWNGYGGGIEDRETAEESAIRELFEETNGVVALRKDLEKIAIVDFHNIKSDGEIFICRVHFYLVHEWVGEVKETAEMKEPTWFEIGNLPLDKMMPADKFWLPIALSGKKIMAKACLGPFQKELLGEVEITYVESFPDND